MYTGIATDVRRRLFEHESGSRGAKFVRGKGPLELVFEKVIGDRALASRIEHQVKRLTRAQKLELIEGRLELATQRADQVLEEGSV